MRSGFTRRERAGFREGGSFRYFQINAGLHRVEFRRHSAGSQQLPVRARQRAQGLPVLILRRRAVANVVVVARAAVLTPALSFEFEEGRATTAPGFFHRRFGEAAKVARVIPCCEVTFFNEKSLELGDIPSSRAEREVASLP